MTIRVGSTAPIGVRGYVAGARQASYRAGVGTGIAGGTGPGAAGVGAVQGPIWPLDGRSGWPTAGSWPAFATAFLDGGLPTVPAHPTPALALRFLADDLKALYSEAVQADGRPPSARQIDGWFWCETIAGRLLIALRKSAMESDNNALKTVGGRFFVPAPFVPA